MALEVRYVPMVDEGDRGYPKIMRVIYNEQNVALSYEPCTVKEAQGAQPDCIEPYFNIVRDYFADAAKYFDIQDRTTNDISDKMLEIAAFCFGYHSKNPIDYSAENTSS
jgi:hypothetical protein